MSQAIRKQFEFFTGSQTGGTDGLSALFFTAAGLECSEAVYVAGLSHKAIEINGQAADLVAFPLVLEGTISEYANDKAHWYPLIVGNITLANIYTIQLGAPAVNFYEPELTHIRLRSVIGGEQAPAPLPLPRSILAVFSGLWTGDDCVWGDRKKQNPINGAKGYKSI